MAVTATVTMKNSVLETLPNNTGTASDTNRRVTHDQYAKTATLNATSTPPATTFAGGSKAMSDGAATLDLTAIIGTNGATVNMTGLKVQSAYFENPSSNANPITISEGASDGYELAGNGWTVVLQPGQSVMFYGADATPDVASGAKDIDISGTGTQALLYSIVAG